MLTQSRRVRRPPAAPAFTVGFIDGESKVLYVPHMILFFHGSLYSNLVYGARQGMSEQSSFREPATEMAGMRKTLPCSGS